MPAVDWKITNPRAIENDQRISVVVDLELREGENVEIEVHTFDPATPAAEVVATARVVARARLDALAARAQADALVVALEGVTGREE